MATAVELTATHQKPTWCPGCGDFVILGVVKMALEELKLEQKNTVIVSGIGCGSKLPHFVKVYGFEGLHGRAMPAATAIKLANKALNVIVVSGDGDTLGIGISHFMHSMRRNLNITHIIENNEVYGLTKGQYSPTTPCGTKTPTSLGGALETPSNPMALGIAGGATFVARGYTMDLMKLKKILVEAIKHKGYSIVDVLQLCPTYNKFHPLEWYKGNVQEVSHDVKNKQQAFAKATEVGEKINVGIFYVEERDCYEDLLPQMKDAPLVTHDISNIDLERLFAKFR